MSGGSLFGGDGMAWRREQEDVLAHAKQLGYDRAGGSIISPTDNKQDWESWRNKFVDWKNKNVALEAEGKAFWQQPATTGTRKEVAPPAPAVPIISPMQEAASRNAFFPMLVSDYSAPQAHDYSAYTKMSPFGGMGGLLYQPGTAQYQQAFPMNEGILRYQPPQLGLIPVSYSNPYALNFEMMEEGGEGDGGTSNNGEASDAGNDQRGGRYGEETTLSTLQAEQAALAEHIAALKGYATVDKSTGTSSGVANDSSRPGGAPATGPHGG